MRVFLLVAGLAVLAIVLHAMGVGTIVAVARQSGWTIVWMILLYAVHIVVRGWVIWRSLPQPGLGLIDTLRIRFAAEAVEMLTFTGPFLAEPAKGWMFIRRGIPAAQTAAVILFEYLTYLVVAAGMALAGLLVLLSRGAFAGRVHGAIVALVAVLVLFIGGVVGAAVTGVGLLVPAVRLVRPLLGAERGESLTGRINRMETHLLSILHASPGRFVEALLAQMAGHGLLAVEIWLLLRALGFHVRAADPLIVEGGVKFINVVFVFIPGQFGAAEGTNALILESLGFPAAVGVTLSLMRRVRAYVVASLGLLVAPPR
jgi:hypothetical protein